MLWFSNRQTAKAVSDLTDIQARVLTALTGFAKAVQIQNDRIERKIDMASQALIDLQNEVAATKTVNASVLTLITSMHQQLDAALNGGNGPDVPALQALAADLREQRNALAAAVTQNTVAGQTNNDVDPSAPPPNPTGASAGGNVYGSGPAPVEATSTGQEQAKAAGTSPAEDPAPPAPPIEDRSPLSSSTSAADKPAAASPLGVGSASSSVAAEDTPKPSDSATQKPLSQDGPAGASETKNPDTPTTRAPAQE